MPTIPTIQPTLIPPTPYFNTTPTPSILPTPSPTPDIDKIVDGWNNFFISQTNGTINSIDTIITNTPNLLNNEVLNIIINVGIDISFLLTIIGFVLNLNMTLFGILSGGGYTIRKTIIRFLITITLVSNCGTVLNTVIDFNNNMIKTFRDNVQIGYSKNIIKDTLTQKYQNNFNLKNFLLDKSYKYVSSMTFYFVIFACTCILWCLGVWRMLLLSFYIAISPYIFATYVMESTSIILVNFIKSFVALTVRTFFYFLILVTFYGLFAFSGFSAISNAFLGSLYSILLIIMLFSLPGKFEKWLGIGGGFSIGGAAAVVRTAIMIL